MRLNFLRSRTVWIAAILPAATFALGAECTKNNPSGLDYAMYLLSKPQDTAACSMKVAGGRIVIDPGITNPAFSCPDMVSWKLYADVIRSEFWKNWASDEQTWPGAPFPLCKPGDRTAGCCDPNALDNPGYAGPRDPAKNCPYYPGDHQAVAVRANAVRIGQAPSKMHVPSFVSRQLSVRSDAENLAVDPGRIIRQTVTEIVFRNKPMLNYIFRNDLYNNEGLAKVYSNNASNIRGGAPYRRTSAEGALSEIDLPVDAVMIKSNWLSEEAARRMNLKENPGAPHIKMTVRVNVAKSGDSADFQDVLFWLVSFHISSKDTPNWAWATFEYQDNPGRCDYTGCNDSYGYKTSDTVKPGQADNYTSPLQQCDNLDAASWIWKTGENYPGGSINPGLASVFDALQLGTAQARGTGAVTTPSPSDRGWRGYRLKGSQTNFIDSTGQATYLGNSVTEGGFVSTSSCITCHSRAALSAPSGRFPALGVFINEADVTGYLQSARGSPSPAWFFSSNTPPRLSALQTDFIWGFFASSPLTPPSAPAAGVAVTAESPPDRDRALTIRNRVQDEQP